MSLIPLHRDLTQNNRVTQPWAFWLQGLVAQGVTYGLDAEKPATAVGVYLATDTGNIYYAEGGAWTQFVVAAVSGEALTGDVTKPANSSVTTLETVMAGGTYGVSGFTPTITVDNKGRITALAFEPVVATTANSLTTPRVFNLSGDASGTGDPFNGTADITIPVTLNDVNADVGTFGSATTLASVTVNAKGLVTGAAEYTLPPAPNFTTPFYVPTGETFTVETNKQNLFVEDITVDGDLVIDGHLVDARSIRSFNGRGGDVTLTTTDVTDALGFTPGTVTSVAASGSTDISVSGSPITTSGTLSFDLTNTTVSPGVYTLATIQVDAKGRIISASSGSTPPPAGVTSVNDHTGAVILQGLDGVVMGTTGPIGSVTIGLGDITPTSVAATGTVTGSNLSGTNTGDNLFTGTNHITATATTAPFGDPVVTVTITSDGTSNNTPDTLVARDGAGAFSAGAISASSLSATGTITGSNLSGTNTGDQTITLSGDVSGSGTGAITTTIGTNKVTNAMLAQVVGSGTIKGRVSPNLGDVEDLNPTQVTSVLDVFDSTHKGLAPASGGGTTNFLRADGSWGVPAGTGVTSISVTSTNGISGTSSGGTTPALTIALDDITPASVAATGTVTGSNLSGTNTGDQTITLSGDVSGSGTSGITATIGANKVTNALLAQVAAATLKGRVTAGTGNVEDLTGTQATTLLDTFTSTLKGLAPASGGGTTNFLRADGIWGVPAGTGVTSFNTRTGAVTLTSGDVTTALGFTPGTGSVTSVSVTTAHGVSGTVATATTTPAITLTLGNITPTSVAATGTVTGSNLSGTNTGDQTITLTGDVTGSGTSTFNTTIGTNTVQNSMLAQVPTATFKGRTTAATGNVEDLTATQATALLDTFTTTHKGLVPPPLGVSGLFLGDDGAWHTGNTGTVTTVSVVTANGLAGTVATPASTPAITLSTTVTGILKGNGTAISAAVAADFPTLNQDTTGTATKAINLTGTTTNSIPYQSASATTSFTTPQNRAVLITSTSGVPSELVGAAGVLQGSATLAPVWTTTPTLTGTNFTGIPNGALTNSSLTIGTTIVALGGSATSLAGLTTVSASSFIAALGLATAPSVTFTGDLNTGMWSPTGDTIAFSTNGQEKLRLDPNGQLGLGVTPFGWASTFRALDLRNNGALGSFGASSMFLTQNAYNDGTNYIYKSTNPASQYLQAGGEHIWYAAASGTAAATFTFTQLLRLNNNGELGLGTGGPAVGTTLRVSKNVTGASLGIGIASSGVVQSDVANYIGIASNTSTQATAFTIGTARNFYTNGGTVTGGSAITNLIGYEVDSTMTSGTNNYGFRGKLASGATTYNLYLDGTAQNFIAGNVGIGSGKTTPSTALDVNGVGAFSAVNTSSSTTNTYITQSGSSATVNTGVFSTGTVAGTGAGTADTIFNAMVGAPLITADTTGGTRATQARGFEGVPQVTSTTAAAIIAAAGVIGQATRLNAADTSTSTSSNLFGFFGGVLTGSNLPNTTATGLAIGSASTANIGAGVITAADGARCIFSSSPGSTKTASITSASAINGGIIAGSGAGTVTIGTLYGLRLQAPVVGAGATITTRYGISQEGTSDQNYLAGKTGVTVQPTSEALTVGGNTVLPKTSGVGLKVDTTTPTFGWRDLLGHIEVRGGGGANDPTWAVLRNGIRAFQFTVNDECWLTFHLDHDYVPGTDIYIHAHWTHASAAVTSGGVTWGFESTVAKGHQQGATSVFGATKTTTVTQTASPTTQYEHFIAETAISSTGGSATLLDNALFEPDSLILVRVFLSANTINGTPEPFLLMTDCHYQSTGMATKQRAPNFYS